MNKITIAPYGYPVIKSDVTSSAFIIGCKTLVYPFQWLSIKKTRLPLQIK